MAGPTRSNTKSKQSKCLACLKPYASQKNLERHMERFHSTVTVTDELDQDSSVLVAAAADEEELAHIIVTMEDDDFEDIQEEDRYTKKEKEMAKKIFKRKLKADQQLKGLLRSTLKDTVKEVEKYKSDLFKMVQKNVDLIERL